jgi:hypothetical protein
MELAEIDRWYDRGRREKAIARLGDRVGLTYTRADCLVRLWIYLLIEQKRQLNRDLKPPLTALEFLSEPVVCSHREAAMLFYSDKECGSDRSAGMMLDKLAALGMIRKHFDGNVTRIDILPIDIDWEYQSGEKIELEIVPFDPRNDAIPVAHLLAVNYNWMNHNDDAAPYRIVQIIRNWAREYDRGMRILRRKDNLNPVGYYALYPVAASSAANFFNAPSRSLHLSGLNDIDPFTMAKSGELDCLSVFIRSWAIAPTYLDEYRVPFLIDAQQTLGEMLADFPNLCDLYTMIIHPSYEYQASALGFQHLSRDRQLSLCWMYLSLDRFLELDIAACF